MTHTAVLKMDRIAVLGAALFLAACAPDGGPVSAASTTTLRLVTGAPDGNFYPRGLAIGAALERTLPGLDVQVDRGEPARNIADLEKGAADVGFAMADVTFAGFHGRLPDQRQPYSQLRAIALFDVAPIHVLARPGAAFRSFADLQGKRVDPGTSNSLGRFASRALLDAYNMTADDIQVVRLDGAGRGYAVAIRGLIDGLIDAKIFVGNIPAPPVIEALTAGARILSVDADAARAVQTRHPFYRPFLIPGGTYPGQPDPVPTVGVETVLLCRAGLDETLVYRITKALFEQRRSENPVIRWPSVSFAPATPIPLHAGAARYYREQVIMR